MSPESVREAGHWSGLRVLHFLVVADLHSGILGNLQNSQAERTPVWQNPDEMPFFAQALKFHQCVFGAADADAMAAAAEHGVIWTQRTSAMKGASTIGQTSQVCIALGSCGESGVKRCVS